jgi:hypothetical protein
MEKSMKHPITRSQRRAQRERIITNRGRLVRNNQPNRDLSKKQNPSLFSKKKPYDCGKSGCRLCHYEKVLHPKMKRLFQKRMLSNNFKEFDDD